MGGKEVMMMAPNFGVIGVVEQAKGWLWDGRRNRPRDDSFQPLRRVFHRRAEINIEIPGVCRHVDQAVRPSEEF